jgi:uncharacterized membrane protein
LKKPEILRLIRLNFFKLLGAALGLIAAVLFLTLGFWRTMLILVLVGGGAAAGAFLDRGQKLADVVDRIFPGSASDDDGEGF